MKATGCIATLSPPAPGHSLRAFIDARATGPQARRLTHRATDTATIQAIDCVERRASNGEPA